MNANAVRYFLEVARAGSFRRAGEALRVAPSAVNRQISILERELGSPLFERSRGRNLLRLTAAGEIFMSHARSAVNELERARYEVEALKGLRAGSVNLGAPGTFARDFLPEFLVQFNRAHPRISFRVVVSETPRLIEMLLRDELEVTLAFEPRKTAAVEIVAELERTIYLMVRADHPLAKRSFIRLSDLAELQVVLPDVNTGVRDLYDRIWEKLGAKPKSILTTSSYEMMRSAARAGLGAALINQYLAPDSSSAEAGVAFIPIRHPIVKSRRLVCCVRRGRRLSSAALAFVQKLKSAFTDLGQQQHPGVSGAAEASVTVSEMA